MLWPGLVFLLCCVIFLRIETKKRHLTFCGVKEDVKNNTELKSTSRQQFAYRNSVTSHIYPVSTTLTLIDQNKSSTLPYCNVSCGLTQKGCTKYRKTLHQALLQQQLQAFQQSLKGELSHSLANKSRSKSMCKQHSEECNLTRRLDSKFNKTNQKEQSDISITFSHFQQSSNIDYLDKKSHPFNTSNLHDNVKSHSMTTLEVYDLNNCAKKDFKKSLSNGKNHNEFLENNILENLNTPALAISCEKKTDDVSIS